MGWTTPDLNASIDYMNFFQVNAGTGSQDPRVSVKGTTWQEVANRRLADFVSTASLEFFDVTGISRHFLALPPQDWPSNAAHQAGKKIVGDLKVVNDCAQRGVKLIKDFEANPLTHGEERLQFLLKLVQKHREELPSLSNKCDIIAHMVKNQNA